MSVIPDDGDWDEGRLEATFLKAWCNAETTKLRVESTSRLDTRGFLQSLSAASKGNKENMQGIGLLQDIPIAGGVCVKHVRQT